MLCIVGFRDGVHDGLAVLPVLFQTIEEAPDGRW